MAATRKPPIRRKTAPRPINVPGVRGGRPSQPLIGSATQVISPRRSSLRSGSSRSGSSSGSNNNKPFSGPAPKKVTFNPAWVKQLDQPPTPPPTVARPPLLPAPPQGQVTTENPPPLPTTTPPVTRSCSKKAGTSAGGVDTEKNNNNNNTCTGVGGDGDAAEVTAKPPPSPFKQLSPRSAKKAREFVNSMAAFAGEKLPSPPATTSKFKGRGRRLATGSIAGSSNSAEAVDLTTDKGVQTDPLLTPATATTAQKPAGTEKTVTVAQPGTKDGPTRIQVDGLSECLLGPSVPRTETDGATGVETVEIPTRALLENAQNLRHNLRALTLEEIHVQFYLLQKLLRQFCKKYFTDQWSKERMAQFDLADLPQTHEPFFRMMAYIADGSGFQDGWADFLTSEHTRPHIVNGAIGEWLKWNLFGHSCFGLSEAEDQAMKNIDIQYLRWDGFVRTKERAKLLMDILNQKPQWEMEVDVDYAVDNLVQEILTVLTPVLPILPDVPERLGHLTVSEKSQMTSAINEAIQKRAEMEHRLKSIIDLAANLHLCIRLTGIDGTILRFQSNEKGKPFAYTARQNCVNKSTVRATLEDALAARNEDNRRKAAMINATHQDETGPRKKDRLIIKMPCFPLVMAVVPYGPTLKDFADEQDMYERIVRSEDLPKIQGTGPMYVEDIPAEIVRASCFEKVPESCFKDDGTRQAGEKKTQGFGSYVKTYILNESDVYCEWEFDGEEKSEDYGLNLRQAAEEAQREKYGFSRTEMVARRQETIENVSIAAAATVTAAALFALSHRPDLAAKAVSAVKNLRLPSSLTVEDIKGAVGSAMKAVGSKAKFFQTAASKPLGVVKSHARSQMTVAQARAKQLLKVFQGPSIARNARRAAKELAATGMPTRTVKVRKAWQSKKITPVDTDSIVEKAKMGLVRFWEIWRG